MIIIGSMLAGLGVIFACLYFGGFIFQGKNRWAQPTVKFTDSEERSCSATVKRLIQNAGGLGISGHDNVRQAHKAAALKPGAKGAIKLSDGKAVKVSVDKNRVLKIDPSQALNAKQKEEITKELAKRAPAKMAQLCDKAGHKIETTNGLFLKSGHKEIKSMSQAKNKENAYYIEKDGRFVLVEYTKLETNRLWYCARCVNMLEKGKNAVASDNDDEKQRKAAYTEFRKRLKRKFAFQLTLQGKGAARCKNFVGRGCGICYWRGDNLRPNERPFTDAQRRSSVISLGGSILAAYWKY